MAVNIKLDEKEINRLDKLLEYERAGYLMRYKYIAGLDEAGRGPLAGPVVAAAVIMDKGVTIPGVNDSKKLSEAKREYLYEMIVSKAISYGVGIVDEKKIDEINILNATYLAMETAISQLMTKPDYMLLDAVKLKNIDIPQLAIIKGDALSHSIAAASIIAKVTRDRIMIAYDNQYPQYGFAKHKGYGTKQHMDAIREFGILPIHRLTFTKNI